MADDMATRGASPHIQTLIAERFSRRTILAGLAGLPALSLVGCATSAPAATSAGALPLFEPVAATLADTVTVPAGFRTQTLISWGDALFDGLGAFNPDTTNRADQERRFGMNNDMLALFPRRYFFPMPTDQDGYLLAVNHEYAGPEMMFPNTLAQPSAITPAQVETALAAMGISVVEITRTGAGGDWSVVRSAFGDQTHNRRITPFTPVVFDGPAASHPWVHAAGPAFNAAEGLSAASEMVACGTLANCAGGQTPWGTYLSAEENFNFYFSNIGEESAALQAARADVAFQRDARSFATPLGTAQTRPVPVQYNMATNPYGPALYGWTLEVDPYDPTWAPRKRTALGRRKGECATTALARDGRVVVYSGDDQADEFVYKFVSSGRFNPGDRRANRELLHEGVLHAATFAADGSGQWLALTVEAANAAVRAAGLPDGALFRDLGDLMVRARDAARLMGATPMDRPEDVEAIHDRSWVGQGPVLVVCTNNRGRREALPGSPDRAGGDPTIRPNLAGHILRLDEEGGDCGAGRFSWDVFALGGDPDQTDGVAVTRTGARVNVSTSVGDQVVNLGDRFACPDNVCFDSKGHVWIATDSSDGVFADCNDAVLITSVAGDGPRTVRRFLVGPVGAEICGPTLTPDETAFFAAIQHPGEGDTAGVDFAGVRWQVPGSRPPSSFPEGNGAWPKSAVVVVSRVNGRPVTD
ncbi:MAG: PhoX family protein [Caulobacterales bacterium]